LLALTRGRRDGENGGPRYDNNTGEPLKPLAKSGNKSLRQQLHRKVFHARRHGYPDSTGLSPAASISFSISFSISSCGLLRAPNSADPADR
jgi:hypothetical protein